MRENITESVLSNAQDVLEQNINGRINETSLVSEALRLSYLLGIQSLGIQSSKAKIRAYEMVNGTAGAEVITNKFLFGQLVNELGYKAPKSARYHTIGRFQYGLLEEAESLDERPERFCTPLNTGKGRGTKLCNTSLEAINFIVLEGKEYLIQSPEIPVQDWRYIYHNDINDEVSTIAFEKVKPHVIGDGVRNVSTLLREDPYIPESARKNYLREHRFMSKQVPELGSKVQLISNGHFSQGAFVRLPQADEKANLDKFITNFKNDLEIKLQTKIGTLCLDIGTLEKNVLEQDYDLSSLKSSIVFYEHQMPFGLLEYLDKATSPKKNNVSKYLEHLSFMRSVIRTGQLLET